MSDHHHPVVRLRPWQRGDAVSLVEAITTSSDLDRQFGGRGPRTEQEAADLIARELSWGPSRRTWAIVLDGHAVGNVAVSSVDRDHDTGWVSYWLARGARGGGLAALATRSVAEWALDEDALHRLELGHRVNNPASCRVALAAGFRPEGVERDKLRYGRERFDVELHARLAGDARPDGPRLPVDVP